MGDEDGDLTRSHNPRLVASRLFLGNLPTERTNKEEISELYSNYGEILAVSLFRGFGFVQFREIDDARRAVEMENGKEFKGNRIDIRIANEGRKPKPDNDLGHARPPPVMRPPLSPAPIRRSLSPHFDRRPPPADFYREHGGPDPYDRRPLSPHYDELYRPPYPVPVGEQRFPPFGLQSAGFHNDRLYQQPPIVVPAAAPQPEALPPPPKRTDVGTERPYDCTIVVHNKEIKSYAEMVERRLMELNMTVDLVFLLDTNLGARTMESLAQKGLLYVVVINKQHAEHKSVTVNILHGTPQEHRNMPLDDALIMLSRDLSKYLSHLRSGSEQPSLSFLLHLLADGKHMSEAELERIIDHLKNRKDQLSTTEGQKESVTAVALPPVEKPAVQDVKKQAGVDLQQKILSILGGGSPAAATTQPQHVGYGLTNPPPVQTATPVVSSSVPMAPKQFNQPIQSSQLAVPTVSTSMLSASNAMLTPELQKTLQTLLQNPDVKNLLNKSTGAETASPRPEQTQEKDKTLIKVTSSGRQHIQSVTSTAISPMQQMMSQYQQQPYSTPTTLVQQQINKYQQQQPPPIQNAPPIYGMQTPTNQPGNMLRPPIPGNQFGQRQQGFPKVDTVNLPQMLPYKPHGLLG